MTLAEQALQRSLDSVREVSLAKDAEIAKLRGVLQDFYDWCGKDYPGWPAVEAALKGNP